MAGVSDVHGEGATMIALLRRRPNFRRLWLGETTSLVGDWLSYVALSLLALERGGGALMLAVVFAGHVLPTALVSPIAGVVVDRVDRRRALIWVQLLQAATMALMVGAVLVEQLVVVQLLLFLRTAVAGFFYPAKQAALRALVADEELVDANALDAATWSATFALGTAAGGLLAMLGPVVALSVDALTFVLAGAIFATLGPIPSERRPSAGLRGPRDVAQDLGQALGLASRDRGLLEAVFAKTPMAFAGGAAWVMLNLVAFELGRDDAAGFLVAGGGAAVVLGLLQAIRGLGCGVGPLAAKGLLRRGATGLGLLRGSLALFFAAVALFAWASGTHALVPLAAIAFVWGIGSGGIWVFASAEMQRRAPAGTLGRLAAVDQLGFAAAQSMAALAAGALVDRTGAAADAGWFGLIGGLVLALGLLAIHSSRVASSLAKSIAEL
jgi:MFS family permease